MSFLEILLDAGNAKEQKKKQTCAILIIITAILLAVAIIAFAICQIIGATSDGDSDIDGEPTEEAVDLGETTSKVLSEEAKYTGNLLTLNNNNHYKGNPVLVDVETARKQHGAFISLFENKHIFQATDKTAQALFEMVVACNKAVGEDGVNEGNLILSNAYNPNQISTQDGIYSSGEAIAISCCYEGNTSDRRPINEVPKYKWIYQNAHKYGFIAQSANSNVFRYVGVTHATAAKSKGLYLDSYLKQLKSATVESPMKLDANGTYVAYTCPINDVKIPNNYSYEISGNNVDGVIVTVHVGQQSAGNSIE